MHTNNYAFLGTKSLFFFSTHLLSILCHYSSPSRHLTKVLPKYLLITKHPSAALFTLFFCGAGYTKSLIKELQNNVNAQVITLSGAISKCNLVPMHSCPSSHICGDAFLPFNHQISVCVTCMSVFIFPSWFGEHVIIPKATSSVV